MMDGIAMKVARCGGLWHAARIVAAARGERARAVRLRAERSRVVARGVDPSLRRGRADASGRAERTAVHRRPGHHRSGVPRGRRRHPGPEPGPASGWPSTAAPSRRCARGASLKRDSNVEHRSQPRQPGKTAPGLAASSAGSSSPLAGILVFLVIWEVGVVVFKAPAYLLPPPTDDLPDVLRRAAEAPATTAGSRRTRCSSATRSRW